ncbi:MAG: hypothetical protein QNJ72_26195 [Pleurocapsa sp. MO_226.B13]|nr:hypothetical protein [Pleurocapsa sp. MO_226.B13]
MTVNYSDPWKDDPYGKIKGNKQTAYFKIILDEAKLYPIDNGYVLAAYVSKYEGILRSFKPERPLEQGLCAIPLYSQDYETRRKEGEKWISVPQRPSKFEQAICSHIEQNKDVFLDEKLVLSGELTHIPDGMCASLDANALNALVADNFPVQLEKT